MTEVQHNDGYRIFESTTTASACPWYNFVWHCAEVEYRLPRAKRFHRFSISPDVI